MGNNVPGSPPEGTPPADFNGLAPKLLTALLGPKPATSANSHDLRAFHPERWPSDKTGLEFLHRGLIRRLWDLGWSPDAAAELRRRLEDGEIHAVLLDDDGRGEYPIAPDEWRVRVGERMFWEGRGRSGFVYLATAREPVEAKAPDLDPRERTTVHKMLLAMAVDVYGYKPGKRSDASRLIAGKSEQLWPGHGVGERTVRHWLKAATDELGDPASEA